MAHRSSDNSRVAPRVHGSEVVEVYSKGLTTPVIGVIRDISETGAHIRIAAASELPEEIRLTSPTAGVLRPARICWRDETNIGIHFDKPASN